MVSTAPGPKENMLVYGIPRPAQLLSRLAEAARTYGDIVHLRIGTRQVYLLSNPNDIHHVLVGEPEKFHKGPGLKQGAASFIGNGLLTSEDDFHSRQRRLVQPAFHSTRVFSYGDVMVDHTLRMFERWQNAEALEIHHEMMALTLSIISKTMFDADVSDETEHIGAAITVGIESTMKRSLSPVRVPFWIPTKANLERREARDVLDKTILRIIEERRASGEDKGDLLSMLLLAIDEEGSGSMNNKQVRDEAMTLFIAGHETTANALTWAWYLLSQHPEIAAQMTAELDAVLAGRRPTVQDLPNLPYNDMIVKEVLRIYPPAWIINREVMERINIGGYDITKGSLILTLPYLMHHDPRYFPEPERFYPNRWADNLEKCIPKYVYFPFGGGPRVCIGQSFAIMEARLILATMAQHFAFDLLPDQHIEMNPLVTLRPSVGIMMTPRVREDQEMVFNAL